MTLSTGMKHVSIPTLLTLGILFSPLEKAGAATLSSEPQPIDLRTWTKEGDPANGNWVVSADGASVRQTKNGKPTFFVSPDEFIDTTISGTFKVSHNDNDFIGFVFGYQSPLATNGDGVNDFQFLLFDWKQKQQTSESIYTGQEGFSLTKVNGTISNHKSSFWRHNSSPEFNVFATNYGSTKGWENNTEYDFTLLYQSDRIKIDIDGSTIFDISADEVGKEFQTGRFGFYNYSQPNVFYSGFTQEHTPPPETPSVPEPSSVLSLLALGAFGVASRLRKQQKNQEFDVN